MPTIPNNDPKSFTEDDAQRQFERTLMDVARQGPTLKGRAPANLDEAKAVIAQDVEASRKQWAESHTDPAMRPMLYSKTPQYESSPTYRLSRAFGQYEEGHPVEQLYRQFAQSQLGLKTVRRPHLDPRTGAVEMQLVHDYSPWYQAELAKEGVAPQRRAAMRQWLEAGRARHIDPYHSQEQSLTGRIAEAASQVDPTRKVQFRYRVMGLNEPIASNLPTGEVNPAYDPSLQPRQRERAASQAQIEGIARSLEPSALLNPAASWAEGPPIIAGGMVESGNARMLALRRAAEINPTGYESYRQQLMAQAQALGLDPAQIRQVQQPVLVRERLTPMEGEQRLRFVSEANASGVARMGAAEQARAEAKLIPPNLFANLDIAESDSTLGDTLRKRSNMPVARGFIERLPETERPTMMTAQGELSAEGVSRLERAMFSYALPGQSGERLSRLVFEEGETLDRLPQGIRQALPSLGKMQAAMQAGHRKDEYAIGEDLANVVARMRDIRQQGLSVDDYLRQHKMFGELTPLQQQLMSQLHERRQSGRQVGELLSAYASAVERTPPPGQGDMFGGMAEMDITREGLLRAALKEIGGEWHPLEQSAAGPQTAPDLPKLANKPTATPTVYTPYPTLPEGPDPVAAFMARRAAEQQQRRAGSIPSAAAGGAGGHHPPSPPVALATPGPEESRRPQHGKLTAWEAMDLARDLGESSVNWEGVDWRGKPAIPPGMERLAQGRYRPGDLVNIATAGGDTRLASAYLRSIRQDAATEARRQGREIGEERISQGIGQGGVFADVVEARELIERQRAARQDWQALNVQYQGAMESGNFGQARKLEKQMNTLREDITEWGDSIRSIQPTLKEHAKLLASQNKEITAEISQLQTTQKARESLRSRLEAAAKQYDPGSPEAAANALQRLKLERGISQRQDRIEGFTRQREAIRTQQAELSGISPLAAPRAAKGAPPSFLEEARGILGQTFNPQNLFYSASNLDQLRYSMWMPLLQARDTYQQSEFTRGQMLYSLGAGAMGDVTGRLRANQAVRSDAWTRVGAGVNQALQPVDNWITRTLRGNEGQEGQDVFSNLGYYGTWGAMGITGLLGAKTFGLDRLAGLGLRHSGQALARSPIVAKMLPRFALPGAGGLLGGLGRAAGAASLATAPFEGINLGAMGYDWLNTMGMPEGQRRFSQESGWGVINKGVASLYGLSQQGIGNAVAPFVSDERLAGFGQRTGGYAQAIASEANSPMATARRLALMPGALLAKGSLSLQESLGLISPERANQLGSFTGRLYESLGNQGIGSTAWNLLTTGQLPQGSQQGQPGSPREPVPVAITKIENPDDLVRALGQTSARAAGLPLDQYQFSEDQLRSIVKEFSESSGLQFGQLREMGGQGYQILQRAVEMGVKSGLDPEQLVQYFAKAPAAAGYLPGGQASLPFLSYISQGTGLTDLQNRMSALQATSREAQFAGLSPQQQVGIAGRYQEIAQAQGEYRASRELSKLVGGNAYDFSDLARRAGRPDLALMDEQGRPMYQAEQWAIQDRQREWQNTTQQTRQGQELEWQQERFDLEQRFWDFRQKRREEDFTFQNRQFNITKKQMEYNIGREERQAQMQVKYQEQQFALQKQIFDLQTKYTRQDFDKQEMRMETQRGWQLQDFAWNRESFELQAGWQMEDMERALRYSSGRERIDIRRQMERAGIIADRKRTEMDREESRATTRYGWTEEDLATSRARFEEMRPLQEEQMALGRQYWEEQKQFADEDRATRKAMMEEQLTLMTDRHNAWLNAYAEETSLMNDQHGLERAMAEERLQWAAADLEEAKRRADEEKQILEWQRQAIEAQQQFNMLQTLGWDDAVSKAKELKTIQAEILRNAEAWADLADSQLTYKPQAPQLPGPIQKFAKGGPVERPTYAMLGEKGEEYVVPSSGALVLRSQGNDEQNGLLREIRDALKAGKGVILIDAESLKQAGFLHLDHFTEAYH